jgi:hypothetical protein
MEEEAVPSWWRPFWGVAATATLTLLLVDSDYSLLAPSLIALWSACFGFEYLADQHCQGPTE